MNNTYAYKFGDNLYINLTNRCCNACDFCIRNNMDGLGADNLWIEREPTANEVIGQIKTFPPLSWQDMVFCGYGEPVCRLDELKKVAAYAKSIGKKVRLNTNGLGGLIYGRDITPELKGLVDEVSVSLNDATAELYDKVCHSEYGLSAFPALIEFCKNAVKSGIHTVMSVVDVIPPENIEKCRQIAKEAGAEFRVREYIK